jgi:DNA-binding GntR family transcriptional regulator
MKLIIKKEIPIRKKVYNYLRGQILEGLIPPNQTLIETKIAREIGASRTPVREALHSLENEKLLKLVPRVGYVVKPISEEEVKQICEIRGAIEALAARWAMKKAHKKLVKDLERNVAAAEQEVSKGDAKALVELDAQFHDIIAKYSGSEQILELSHLLRRQMLRYRLQSLPSNPNPSKLLNGHKSILEAIIADNPETVVHAINYHLDQSLANILKFGLKEEMEKGQKTE